MAESESLVDFARLDAERKRRGLSWWRIAELTKISQSAISRWKKGVHDPDLPSIVKLADLFGLSVDQLLGRLPRSQDLPTARVLNEREERVLQAYQSSPHVRKIVDTVVGETAEIERKARKG